MTVLEWVNFLRFHLYNSSIWKGIVLSDLGLTATDPRVRRLADRIFQYKLHLNSDVNRFTEEICIVGNAVRMLTRIVYIFDRQVRKLYDWIMEDQRVLGGWNFSTETPDTQD